MVIEFTVLGDSLTTGRQVNLAFGISTGLSWVVNATSTPGLHLQGGFARSGYNSYQINENAVRVARPGGGDVDVLVTLSGTNDMSDGMDRYRTQKYIMRSVDTVHAIRTLIVAIPPMVGCETRCNDFNDWLEQMAYVNGCDYLDPWATVRASDGNWIPGFSDDGRHPNAAGTIPLGQAIRNKIIDMTPAI